MSNNSELNRAVEKMRRAMQDVLDIDQTGASIIKSAWEITYPSLQPPTLARHEPAPPIPEDDPFADVPPTTPATVRKFKPRVVATPKPAATPKSANTSRATTTTPKSTNTTKSIAAPHPKRQYDDYSDHSDDLDRELSNTGLNVSKDVMDMFGTSGVPKQRAVQRQSESPTPEGKKRKVGFQPPSELRIDPFIRAGDIYQQVEGVAKALGSLDPKSSNPAGSGNQSSREPAITPKTPKKPGRAARTTRGGGKAAQETEPAGEDGPGRRRGGLRAGLRPVKSVDQE